jgi:two-component system sensor histidine kinase PilS (NtrC family)
MSRTPGAAPAAAPTELRWRIVQLLNLFRLLAPAVLLAVYFLDAPTRSVGAEFPRLFIAACGGWFAFGVLNLPAIARRWPPLEWQAVLQLAGDTVAVVLIVHASGGIGSGLATLLVLPAGAIALVVRPRLSLTAAAAMALALLGETLYAYLRGTSYSNDFLASGLTGASLFAITLLAIAVADRLRESEALVQKQELDLANLNQLNEFIVQRLRESILVVDAYDRIRLINETASRVLRGGPVARETPLAGISQRLLQELQAWRTDRAAQREAANEFVSADGGTAIRPHFVPLSQPGTDTGAVLVFLEDTSVVAQRVQQSKLAALGRLSASIAHEIRNPVGAMSHAAQLLRESPAISADEQRLTEIIEKNGARVSQIIENVLQLSRRDATRRERLSLSDWAAGFVEEYRQTQELGAQALRLELASDLPLEVQVDPTQLQQVVWNLVENARRHGVPVGAENAAAGVVEVRLGRIPSSERPFIEVCDRGPGIPPDHAERIFEPFYTSGRGGTGLGLFISRELCQTNGAVLLHEQRPGGGSVFRVIFPDPGRWER